MASRPSEPAPTPASTRPASKANRVLACVLCQQRKIKCDRKFPCGSCVRASAQCVPATLAPRQRRRRFPERELLERLRHYEGLLRAHSIEFDPLHPTADQKWTSHVRESASLSPADTTGADAPSSREDTPIKSETTSDTQTIWGIINKNSHDNEEDDDDDADDAVENGPMSPHSSEREIMIKKAWSEFESNDHLLFGLHKSNIDLSTLHPPQARIFKLWQIYLDNVDPLLKVTHTPTLQTRFIDAAGNIIAVDPTLEALMFSIYCVALLSIDETECMNLFGSAKAELLRGYQFGCHQALLNSGVLRTDDRDCLTALYLYLISVRADTDPRSLSSILGAAMRIAQRMGIHNELSNSRYGALEAEMRRRLWWSFILFDNRICEMCEYNTTGLSPTWDCRTVLNVMDFDLRPQMKTPPTVHERPTDNLFAVVRSELGDAFRHCAAHLAFTNPALRKVTKDMDNGNLFGLEEKLQIRYFNFCSEENPLHFMTMWTSRGHIAKFHLLGHFLNLSSPTSEAERDTALSYALVMLKSDTKLMASPLTKGFRWLIYFHFPFLAYVYIAQDLRRRPVEEQADNIFRVMDSNYEVRSAYQDMLHNPLFKVFTKTMLLAWEGRQALFKKLNKPLAPPPLVLKLQRAAAEHSAEEPMMNLDDLSMTMPLNFDMPYSTPDTDMLTQTGMNIDLDQLDWTFTGWNLSNAMNQTNG